MKLIKRFFLLALLFSSIFTRAQLQQLRVSDNKHFLVTMNGKPFFWLGDTGWELFHRLGRIDAETYFKKRSAQGFTVIQAVVLAELNGLHSPNANGELPLLGDDPAKPNPAYFNYVDTLIDLAAKYNLYIALLPTWGDKVYKNRWGVGPEIFTSENIFAFGKWIGARYKNKTNIIWVIGGDRSPRDNSQDVAIWRALAKGITEGVGGQKHAVMTFHPQPDGTSSSSQWFQQDEWLSLNMLQTGHCRDTPVWELVEADYKRQPQKPVVNGENIYEEMPVCFNAKELGYGSAFDVRKSAYLSVFAGACGHTYGCGPVIWFSEKTDNLFAQLHTWREAMDLAGANEMKWLRALMESRPFIDRVPAEDLLEDSLSGLSERVQATRGKDYIFVYSAYGKRITLRAGSVAWDKVSANWYDPRTGKSTPVGSFINDHSLSFEPPQPISPPVPTEKEDWVLILDDASKNYPMPLVK
jgi:hypothetical protein